MKRMAQAVTEYIILIVVVAAAIIVMNLYIQRSANDRLHNIELETNPVVSAEGPRNALGEVVNDELPAGEPGAPGERAAAEAAGTGGYIWQDNYWTVNLDNINLPYSR